nr:zinc finger and SCAN domain-containing protein 12-like [Leptinotarsa decemlineata]
MGSEHYCLRWNNHQSNLLGVFSQLLRDESLVDVTLACSEGHSIRAHKVVLSACSSYFQTLFVDHPSRHPIVILKDVRFAELRTLIEFMYKGEVNVEYCQLSALLKTAESLKVKGLAEMTREYKPLPEQLEPKELTTRRAVTPDEMEESQHSPSSVQNLRICKSPLERDRDRDRDRERDRERDKVKDEKRSPSVENTPLPASSDCGASDMTIHNSNNLAATCSSISQPPICSRLPSPLNCEPLPGPSNLPPVQQVPLSLKKEVDWGGGGGSEEAKPLGDSASDYSRNPQDSTSMEVDRCIGSPVPDRPSSTQSSRSSTPFALPFPTIPTSLLEVGLMHPALLGEEMFRCSSCMAAFPSLWLLEQHTALQHIGSISSLDKPFVCEQCGQSYRYRSAYVKHREQNHRARLPADKLFSCDVCGMQFRYLKSFKKHRLNHALEKLHGKSGDIPKEVKNTAEDENVEGNQDNSSDQVSSSNETINVEEESSPIVVKTENISDDVAAEGTSSDAEKTEAEQDDTIDSIAYSFQGNPSTCASELLRTSESSIINFLRADSAERQRERRFACPFCGKCVRSKENLKLHVRKHTGERPFVCLFCGRAFGGKSDLTRHLRIHTGERPYHCDMCGKCFARADYLSKHLTTHINTPR